MHIITQSRIWQAKLKYPESANALDGWFRVIKKINLITFLILREALIV